MLNLDENWTTVRRGSLGYIGFCADKEQSADRKLLKVWLTVFGTGIAAEQWHDILKDLFKAIEWNTKDGLGAIITIQLREALKNPDGLLKSLADQIESRYEQWVCSDREEALSLDDEEPEEYQPQQVWFTESPCGHNGWE